jgi:hypothetical protein
MIREREIIYQIDLIQSEISYFERYKNNLTEYFLEHIKVVSKTNAYKIIEELNNVGLHIYKLSYLQKQYYTILNNNNNELEN